MDTMDVGVVTGRKKREAEQLKHPWHKLDASSDVVPGAHVRRQDSSYLVF
jgi:hypothetical protein